MPLVGALAEPWWVPVLWVVIFGHITNICVTLYLHRSATHEGVKFAPPVEHFMRLWLYLTTGMNTREWVAVHRKHHAFSDREGDPHSPANEGLFEIMFGGVFFYRDAARDKETIDKYGKGCPEDWVENRIYSYHRFSGLLTMLAVDLVLFGLSTGLLVWAAMAIWIPVFGQVINGIGHAIGYRNFDTKDQSRNIIPIGLWIVGEELHNNHHADPRSAKFQAKWYEFDIGWLYIRLLAAVRLAKVIYARNVSAREFTEKYYTKAADVAKDAAGRAERAARDAATRAGDIAHNASSAITPSLPAAD